MSAGAPANGYALASDGCRIRFRVDGPAGAPCVLFSNSLGTTLDMWDGQLPSLAERFRVVRYDVRGHGGSGVPAGPYTIERLGADALAVLDAAGIERASFCGLSLGGMTAQWLGAYAGERIERLVIANSAAQLGPAQGWDERIAAVTGRGMGAVTQTVLERWFTPEFRASAPAAVARVRRMLEETDPAGYAGCCAAIRDLDLREALGSIEAPALVIAGERDPSTPPAVTLAIAAGIAGARVAQLDCAHLSNVECGAEFNELLVSFLGAVRA